MNRSATMPQSRSEQLVIQETDDEVLVYDLSRHKAHCLNQSASFVWSRCDGLSTVADTARALHEALGLPANEDVVYLALDHLGKARLLDVTEVTQKATGNPGRRDLLKRIGVVGGAALALPFVTSILAPTPASAATCLAKGATCTSSAQCCSGLCLKSGKCA